MADRESRGLFDRVAGRVTERVVETVQPDLILDHVDIDALVARVDLNAALDRVDPNALLDRVDPNPLLDRVDVDALLERVDANALVDRVDINAPLERVDANALLARLDIDALISRVDIDALMSRVDVDALISRVDVDALISRVDIDALMSRVDVAALAARSGVGDLVAASTSQMATSALDVARRQIAGLDTVLQGAVSRLLRRDRAHRPVAPPLLAATATTPEEIITGSRRSVTGHYAGIVPRALAAMLDVLVVFATFSLGYAGVELLTTAFFGVSISEHRAGPIARWAFLLWAFGYLFWSVAVSGRTLGKAILGLRVVCAEGTTVTPGRALVRTLAVPLSIALFGFGFLLSVVHPRQLALHDLIAGTAVVHDWGDRPAELSDPLSAFLDRASASA